MYYRDPIVLGDIQKKKNSSPCTIGKVPLVYGLYEGVGPPT